MREITKIGGRNTQPVKRKRVAAYARVSSGKDAQLHSLSAQISYYNNYIGSRGDWELAGIYADEAMTGTKENRPQFQKLLSDCRAGKIDMVIVKSITRLARNTVTLLETARELKALEIDILFEKENIHTLSTDGELMLTLLASFAQEESRSASENVKWRIRKNFERGIPTGGGLFGYRFKDGMLQVVPEEAEIVKQIFNNFLSGMGIAPIAKKLNREGVPTRRGNLWSKSAIRGVLQRETYTGNLLLQKTYKSDHITKKKMINHGELPMYYVEDSHEAIIDRKTFQRVQNELERRAAEYSRPHTARSASPYLFTGMIRCGLCGRHFSRKLTASDKKYTKKPQWVCSTFHVYGKSECPSQRIPEDILIAKTSEVLGHDGWGREELTRDIDEILVPEHNCLVYVFHDGHMESVHWRHPSRRESWTPEMRQKARERQLEVIRQKRKGDEKECRHLQEKSKR